MPVLKNAKHERFAQGLASGKTADEAYAAAGFKADRGNASRLQQRDSIRQRVSEVLKREETIEAKATERAIAQLGITKERVLTELGRIGFSDIRKAFTPSGHILSPDEWDDDFAASVAGIEVVSRTTNEKDADGRVVVEHVHKFKTWDKRAALVDIGKHLGMFKDDKDAGPPAVTIIIQGADASIL